MVHIFWTGKGFLVAVAVFGCSLVANLTVNALTGGEAYWNAHRWPFAVALFVAAAICWVLGRFFHQREARVLLDAKTGEPVVLRPSHTLFFIPMRWWGPVLAILGLVALGAEFLT